MLVKNHIKVSLKVTDFLCSSSEITNVLGFLPTKIWEKGDIVHPKAENLHKQNGWIFSKEDRLEKRSVHEISMRLLLEIGEKIENFSLLPDECEIEFSCVIYVYTHIPEINLPSKLVEKLAKIGCSLDFDVYYFCEE